MSLENGRGDTADTESDDGGTSRRKLMAAGAATWATASVAGCGGSDGTDTQSPTATDTPEPEPANYVVTDEMATASAFGVSFASSCSPTRIFAPGMTAIWEINVYDPESGEQLTSDDLSAVNVNIDGGGTVETQWMGDAEEHPAPIWEGSWDIPAEAEAGEWTYTIEVQAEEDASFTTVGEATGSFTVKQDEMPDFYVSTETYWNGHPAPEGTNGFVGTCAPEREFFTTMDPTFYVQIYATQSGKLVGTENEDNSKVDKVSEHTVGGVTVRFPDSDIFDPLDLAWMPGAGDENTAPHWGATLTEPAEIPPGSYAWEVDIEGVNEKQDVKIVGAAADVFNVIEKNA